MTPRKSVMISSTARDLPDHREQVRLACERAGFAPHDMMEHLPALDADAITASLTMVEQADVYIGVFAYRYGYVPDGHDISITEMEYDRAVELNKPRLIFFIHDDHPVTGKDVETGLGALKLQALKDRIGKARVAAFFRSAEDLRGHVVEALTALTKQLDAAGPEAASERAVAALHRKSAIPEPPEPYIAHPYTLLQTRELVGRQAELNALTDWVAKPRSPAHDARVFALVAIGGMGKSALAWKWFNQIAPNEMKPLAGRLWWSFYESDATFENFLNRALCYVSGEDEAAVRALAWHEREALLLRHLSEKPYLFVLDGLERILLAYNRMDASTLSDDQLDRQTANFVAGAAGLPASAAQSFTGEHRLRQTTDPRAGAFLRKLTQVRQSRVLITTRLYPYALQLPNREPCVGCFAFFLRGLNNDGAIELWRTLKVTGSRNELATIFHSIEGHPLLVQVFAGVVANYRKAPGDFAQWMVDHPQFDPTSLLVEQSRARIIAFALDSLSAEARAVLHTIAGFRMPANYATLEALLVGAGMACGTIQQIDQVLTELEDRGLIGWDRDANRYDAHPIVRGVVWQLTEAKDKRAVLTALEAHFEPMATPGWLSVESLADLAPAIERYHTLIGLERYSDAYDLFCYNLLDASLYRLSAHRERLSWLTKLFPEGIDGPSTLTDTRDQSHALGVLAQSYHMSGRLGLSIPIYRKSIEILSESSPGNYLPNTSLSNIGIALTEIGHLRESISIFTELFSISFDNKRTSNGMVELREFSSCLNTVGLPDKAMISIHRAKFICEKIEHFQGLGVAVAFLAQMFLSVGSASGAAVYSDRAWALATQERHERDFIRAALLQGRAALGLDDLGRADERLHHALVRTRAVNVVEFELPALIALAQLDLKRGLPTEAKTRLDDVWEPAELGPYPLQQADAYNVLSEIEIALDNKAAAIEAATKAYRAAWCDGPPYAYHWGLEKAKARLAALDAPEPDMPAFDESKFGPLPEVEINPKDEYWVDPDTLQ